MHRLYVLLLLGAFLASFCSSDRCRNIGDRYSDISNEFKTLQTDILQQRNVIDERRLKKLLKQAQKLESDFEGCGIGTGISISDKLGQIIDSYKVSQLKREIEHSLPHDHNKTNQELPDEWDIRRAIRKIEKSLQELYPIIKIDEAGNVEMQGQRFYIESVRTEVVDSGISIACIRNEQCISDNLSATGIPMDHMKSQRIVEYLNDYKAVIVCKHSKADCSGILKKYKN